MTALIEQDSLIHELATLLIGRYGERAASYARHQSLKAAHRDERRTMEAWRWIADAVEQVWRAEPKSRFG